MVNGWWSAVRARLVSTGPVTRFDLAGYPNVRDWIVSTRNFNSSSFAL